MNSKSKRAVVYSLSLLAAGAIGYFSGLYRTKPDFTYQQDGIKISFEIDESKFLDAAEKNTREAINKKFIANCCDIETFLFTPLSLQPEMTRLDVLLFQKKAELLQRNTPLERVVSDSTNSI